MCWVLLSGLRIGQSRDKFGPIRANLGPTRSTFVQIRPNSGQTWPTPVKNCEFDRLRPAKFGQTSSPKRPLAIPLTDLRDPADAPDLSQAVDHLWQLCRLQWLDGDLDHGGGRKL